MITLINSRFKLLLFVIAFGCVSMAMANEPEDLLNNLTERQRFKAYPRIEKAYEYVNQKRYAEAFAEVQKVREYLPKHRPLALYAVNLLILDGQFAQARALAETFAGDAEFDALAANANDHYIRAKDTSFEQFQMVTQNLSADELKAQTVSYLFSHQETISLADTLSLYKQLSPEIIDSQTAQVFNELLIKHEAYHFLFEHQQALCDQRTCSKAEWQALTSAALRLNKYEQLNNILTRAPQSLAPELIDSAIDAMVGAEAYQALLNVFMPLTVNNQLNSTQLNRLYVVARQQDNKDYANALLQRLPSDCMDKADQFYQLENYDGLAKALANCPLTPANAEAQFALLTESKHYSLLAQKRFTQPELQQRQRAVLYDVYTGEEQWQKIITMANSTAPGLPLTPVEQRILANAYAQTDQLPQAIGVTLALWKKTDDVTDLDLATYYLSQHNEQKRALTLISDVIAHGVSVATFSPALQQRLLNLITAQASELSTSKLQPLLAAEQTQKAAVDALLADNQCQRSMQLVSSVSNALKERIILACEQNLDKRLAFLQQGLSGRSDSQKAEVAFALIAKGDGEAADQVINDIEGWQNQWLFVNAKLSIAEQQNDVAAQQRLLTIAEQFPEQQGLVAVKRAYLAYNNKDYQRASELFNQAFSSDTNQQTTQNLEQAVFAKQFLNESKDATQLLRQSIDVRSARGETSADENIALAQSLYRQISSPWNFSLAGWIGRSANVTESTAKAFQSKYFVSSELTYDLTYDSSMTSDITLGFGTLSGGDDFFFDRNEADLFVAYKPWKDQSLTARLGVRNTFDSHNTRSYARVSYDPLQSLEAQKHWNKDTNWLSHSLFLDAIYYFDSSTYSIYSRYKPSYDFSGEHQLFYSASVYPFIQYQRTNDVANKGILEDTRLGAGLTHRSTWFDADYKGYELFAEISLEWQYVIDSDFSEQNDNALLLRFALFY